MVGDISEITNHVLPLQDILMMIDLLINLFKFPIKRAYFVISSMCNYEVSNYVAKRCSDVEVILVLYY